MPLNRKHNILAAWLTLLGACSASGVGDQAADEPPQKTLSSASVPEADDSARGEMSGSTPSASVDAISTVDAISPIEAILMNDDEYRIIWDAGQRITASCMAERGYTWIPVSFDHYLALQYEPTATTLEDAVVYGYGPRPMPEPLPHPNDSLLQNDPGYRAAAGGGDADDIGCGREGSTAIVPESGRYEELRGRPRRRAECVPRDAPGWCCGRASRPRWVREIPSRVGGLRDGQLGVVGQGADLDS